MIGLPHRVGAAYVVLGQANGTEPRTGHVLNSNQYGGGSVSQFHTYYGNYPESTTPDYIITKVAGTLGEDYTYTSPTSENIPGNVIKIVSYKTELNHYLPDAAKDADSNLPTYSSQSLLQINPPPIPPGSSGYYIPFDFWGNESVYISEQLADFNALVAGSFVEITDVTDNIDGSVETFTPAIFYPRWTAEGSYDQSGRLNQPIAVTLGSDDTFYQTREGPAMTAPSSQVGIYWTQPWGIGRVTGSGLNQRLNIDCNVSYKFTVDGTHAAGSVAEKIVYPWGKLSPDPYDPVYNNFFGRIADECEWQYSYDAYTNGLYSQKYPEGAYRTVPCPVWPIQEGQDYPYVNYQNTATHGLFLSANGSCWNVGTEIKVKVHIWKAPPKFCLYYRNKNKDGGGTPYLNWKTGYTNDFPTKDYQGGDPLVSTPLIGSGYFEDGNFRFEGGIYTGVDYSFPEPNPVNLHYWGTVFAPDTDSEDCEEHEVLEFTVTIDETNTYLCDGTPREGVEMTPWGFKVDDIELPAIEGYITYIKDFEVTSVKKPPSA